MRKGIADLYRRAQVSQKVNERYLDALAQTDDSTTLDQLIGRLHRPAVYRGKRSGLCVPLLPMIAACCRPSARASSPSMGSETGTYRHCSTAHPQPQCKKAAVARQLSVVSCAYYVPITSSARFPPVIAINLHPWGVRSSPPFLPPAMLRSTPSWRRLLKIILRGLSRI